jgi:hypothetical protein
MKVINKIKIYEINGELHRRDFVVIKSGDKKITILADELKKAIENSTR